MNSVFWKTSVWANCPELTLPDVARGPFINVPGSHKVITIKSPGSNPGVARIYIFYFIFSYYFHFFIILIFTLFVNGPLVLCSCSIFITTIPHLRWYTITYKSRLTQKKLHKKNDAIFSIYGKNGINPWHFFWILSWAFRGRWGQMKIEVEFLRLRPRNFAIIPDTFSPHLKMVR